MLRQTTMLQSCRDLDERPFRPAKPEPTDHVQNGRHSPRPATVV
jgi:hypothetical protein